MLLFTLIGVMAFMLAASGTPTEPLPDFDLLWDYSQPAKTEAAFRELLPRARSSGNTGYLVELLSQIARTQGLQKKFDDAHATLDEAKRLLKPELKRGRVRYLLERGRVFNSSLRPKEARPLFLEAWETAKAAGEDNLAVDAAHMMGIVEPPEEALNWSLKALELAEKSPRQDVKRWLGPLYNNIGWTYFDRKELDRAQAMLEKALVWFAAHGKPRQIRIAKWSVAKLWRIHGRVKEALEAQQALLKEYEQSGEQNGFVCEEVGECLLALGRDAEAKPHFATAYELLSKDDWLVSNEPERLRRLKKLSGLDGA